MSDYKVTDTELTSVANAIRTRGGTSEQLEWPNGFITAIENIPSTQPTVSYTVTASSTHSKTDSAQQAMQGGFWGANTSDNSYLTIEFTQAVTVTGVKFNSSKEIRGSVWKSSPVTLKASNDGTNWTDLAVYSNTPSETAQYHAVSNNTAYIYYRFYCVGYNDGNKRFPGLGKIEMTY